MSLPVSVFSETFPAREEEGSSGAGKRPFIFDVLGPDQETSLLPEGVRLVLKVNPKSVGIKYAKQIERIQTEDGFVEQHWGDQPTNISMEASTGGFMRLYTGLTSTTNADRYGGSRRETLGYDSYLDMLALFHNNASIYDLNGKVVMSGILKLTFDQGVYLGWFEGFNPTESADNPFQFTMSTSFIIKREVQRWRTAIQYPTVSDTILNQPDLGQSPV